MQNCSNMSNKGDQWPQMVFSKPICVEVARLSWLGQLVQSVIAEPHVPISVLTRLDVQQLWQCPNLWCVRLSRLLVGFRTHFKWLHFDFQFWCTDVTFILLFKCHLTCWPWRTTHVILIPYCLDTTGTLHNCGQWLPSIHLNFNAASWQCISVLPSTEFAPD